jgi:predicted phage tail protein
MAYFGPRMDEVMHLTAPIVDALEVAMHGFKRWLEVTGFGNDKTMFKGFVKWAENRELFTGAGDILEATRVVLN